MKRFLLVMTAGALVLFICGMQADDHNGHRFDDRWFNHDQNDFRRFDPWRFDFDREEFRRFDPRRFDFDRDDLRRFDQFKNTTTVKEMIHPKEVVSMFARS